MDFIGQILAASLATLPLFIIPSLVKRSMNVLGGDMSKLLYKGQAQAKAGAVKKMEASTLGQALKYKDSRKEINRAKGQGGQYRGRKGIHRGGLINPLNYAGLANAGLNRISGGFGDRRSSQGEALEGKEMDEAVAIAEATTMKGRTGADNIGIAVTGKIKDYGSDKERTATDAEIEAAAKSVMGTGSFNERKSLYGAIGNKKHLTDKRRINSITGSGYFTKGDHKKLGIGGGNDLTEGKGFDTGAALLQHMKDGGVSGGELMSDDSYAKSVADITESGILDPTTTQAVMGAAERAKSSVLSSDNINEKLVRELERISPTPPAAPAAPPAYGPP